MSPFLPCCKFWSAQSFPLTASLKIRIEASIATPGGGSSQRGGLQLALWPLASTVAACRCRKSSRKDPAACIISALFPWSLQLHPPVLWQGPGSTSQSSGSQVVPGNLMLPLSTERVRVQPRECAPHRPQPGLTRGWGSRQEAGGPFGQDHR